MLTHRGDFLAITLIPKSDIDIMLEAEVITPDAFAGKSAKEIGELLVWQGPKQYLLADFFNINGSSESNPEDTSIVIDGNVSRVKNIGSQMSAGNVIINGSAGMHVGACMTGGQITVKGNVDSWAGMDMCGGTLHIEGDAKDHAGGTYRGKWHGMSGGKIIIEGSALSQLGGGMDDGQIIVNGNVENFCGIRQSGGLIVVGGNAISTVGAEMSGGTIVIGGSIRNFLPGFEYEGTESDLVFDDIECKGDFKKFNGDYAISNKGNGFLYASKANNSNL